jgi:hypothetical protein
MVEIVKFHEKNVALYGKIESVVGTYVAPAATDVLAATSMAGSVTYETGAYQYLGDNLSRDEFTYQKDSFADINVETLQQVLGVLNPSLAVADVPLSEFMQACGGYVTVNASTGVVTIDNNTVSDSALSIDFRKSSSQDLVNQKLYKFTACRGMVDIDASLGEIPKLKYTFKGNAAAPIESPILAPSFGSQTTNIASTVRQSTIATAKIAPAVPILSITFVTTTATVTATGHGLSTGNTATISGATGADGSKYNGTFTVTVTDANVFTYTMTGTPSANATGSPILANDTKEKTFCFSTLSAPNFFGFEYGRYLTGCEEGFSKDAIATDVSVSMLEDKAQEVAISSLTSVTTTATAIAAGHGLSTGNSVTVKGAQLSEYNITATVTVIDANTFTYTIVSVAGVAATGTLSFINNSATAFDPDANVSKFFAVKVKFGTAAGKYITYRWNKLQLSNVKDGKVGAYLGRDVTFRSTGRSYIIME